MSRSFRAALLNVLAVGAILRAKCGAAPETCQQLTDLSDKENPPWRQCLKYIPCSSHFSSEECLPPVPHPQKTVQSEPKTPKASNTREEGEYCRLVLRWNNTVFD